MPIMEVHITPVGTGSAGMHDLIARSVKEAASSNLKYQITAMGTALEGPLDRLLDIARRMHLAALEAGAPRVVTSIRIDERKGRELSLEERVREVEESLRGK